jgi:hypothetical protein
MSISFAGERAMLGEPTNPTDPSVDPFVALGAFVDEEADPNASHVFSLHKIASDPFAWAKAIALAAEASDEETGKQLFATLKQVKETKAFEYGVNSTGNNILAELQRGHEAARDETEQKVNS